MKKQLLFVLLLALIVPMASFNAGKPLDEKVHLIKKTDWLVGYFMVGTDIYEVTGDNFGGTSGNVTQLSKNGGTPYAPPGVHLWGYTFGPAGSTDLGVKVTYASGPPSQIYIGLVAQ